MINLYEILSNAQGGAAIEQLSRQYGLTPEQTRTAIESLLPAFQMGLEQATSTPEGLATLITMMGQPNVQTVFDNTAAMFGRQGLEAGNAVLGVLFGSKDMTSAFAAQAAQFAGVGPDVLKQMMPVIAAVLVGGMLRGLQQGGLGGMFGQVLGQMTGGGMPGMPRMPGMPVGFPGAGSMPNPADVFGNFIGTVLGGLFGSATPGRAPESASPDRRPADEEKPTSAQRPGSDPGRDELSDLTRQLDAAGRDGQALAAHLFETGREVQQAHLDSMRRIFEAFAAAGKGGR